MQIIPNPLIIPIGVVIGILVAAPVGPVNVLCIQRAIERGFFGGLAAGLGAVLGDGLIALCAATGVQAISGAVKDYRSTIQIIGGLALIAFGARLYLSPPKLAVRDTAGAVDVSWTDFLWDIPQTFFLTVTNPGAVLGLFAIFGGVTSFVEVASYVDAVTMVAAIMAGSLVWWIALSQLVGRIRHQISGARLHLINKSAGVLLVGFGGVLVGEVIFKLATAA